MSSALDTLLEAARYIELQEQRGSLVDAWILPPNSGRYRYENSTNNLSSSSIISTGGNNIRNNNSRHIQDQVISSSPVSPNLNLTNGINNNHVVASNHHDFTSEYGSPGVISNTRSVVEEPYLNGHSNTLPGDPPSKHMNDTEEMSSNDSPITIQYSKNYMQNLYNINKTNNNHNLLPIDTTNNYNKNSSKMKFVPLTPPPMPSRKISEPTRIRSISLSSHKITANGNSGSSNGISTSGPTSLLISNNNTSNSHNVLAVTTEDSSQSSLNLSSSGYLSGSSVNSSVGGSNLNLNNSISGPTVLLNGDHPIPIQTQSTGGRRRTTSTNSNGGTQRSPCMVRAGTREVHNKLEKHRRAHLKECFEQLKVQLQLKDEEKKKTSNLAILGAAYRHVISLRRKERELEQQVEQLAKEKINAQKKIVSLKRELVAKYDNIDFTTIISDGDIGSIPVERGLETQSDSVSLSTGRCSIRYSSSSSLSSGGTTISSPLGAGMPCSMTAISSVIPSSNTSPNSSNIIKAGSPVVNGMPLSLTTKGFTGNSVMITSSTRGSPTPSTPSPSPSSSGVSSSSSASPPMGLKISANNITSGTKSLLNTVSNNNISSALNSVSFVTTTTASPIINIKSIDSGNMTTNLIHSSNLGVANTNILPLNLNVSQAVQIPHNNINNISHTAKDLSGKNGITRKIPLSDNSRDMTGSPSRVILTSNNNIGNTNMIDENEHPTKVIKLFNGIALAPVDKDNKIISSTPLSLSQVVGSSGLVLPIPMLASQGLRVIGANGLATIELSSSMQSPSRNHIQTSTPPLTSVTSSTGAQLQKLLISGGTTITGNTLSGVSVSNSINSCIPTFSHANTANIVSSELARLPGGAELNILPTGANGTTTLYRGNGKLAFLNNGITLKGSDSANNTGRQVHVMTPIQSGASSISGLTPIVVSQGQPVNNIAHIIASSPQLAGKMNLSVAGQTLPLINTQYLGSMKQMVVAVASNATPTLASVPPTSTSAAVATGNVNGNSL